MDLLNTVSVICGLISLGFLIYCLKREKLQHIPSPGPTGPISSWFAAYKYASHASETIGEGYEKYKGRVFRVSNLLRWIVVLSSPTLVEELRKAPDEVLSFKEGINHALQLSHTFGKELLDHGYHIPVIRSQLTRHLSPLFLDIHDEIVQSFNDLLPRTDDWVKVPVLQAVMQVVSRTSNRVFVGLPVCRNPAYNALLVQFATDIVKAGIVLHFTPKPLKDLVGRLISPVARNVKEANRFLGNIIAERLRLLKEHGDGWTDKPSDMLQWLIEHANEDERTVDGLVVRILLSNFAAIHTSSTSFTHALFTLAAHPEFVGPLREEVEQVVREDGWTKAAVQRMRKLDSFMRECQRWHGLGALSMGRIALQDYTFSDGTFVPKGTLVAAASRPMHHDNAIYAHADIFDPWRFANMRQEEGEGIKHQMVNTSADYIAFGHGKHACPGRFFAVNELKLMMAHILLNYDVKPEAEGVVPRGRWFRHSMRADPAATAYFRKRRM